MIVYLLVGFFCGVSVACSVISFVMVTIDWSKRDDEQDGGEK